MFILLTLLLFLPGILFFITLKRNIFGKIYIFSIEGNIGSGKSTLVKKLKNANPNYYFLQEPVDIWKEITNSKNENILSKFYTDKKRYSYTFQNFAFITRISTLKNIINKIHRLTSIFKDKYLIVERSIYSDKHVFAKMLHDNKQLSELEYKIYNYWFYKLHTDMLLSGHIYLKVDPKVSLKRVEKRARAEETDSIPIEYLNTINEYHDTWLNNSAVPTLVINGDNDFENNTDTFNIINNQVKIFINNI